VVAVGEAEGAGAGEDSDEGEVAADDEGAGRGAWRRAPGDSRRPAQIPITADTASRLAGFDYSMRMSISSAGSTPVTDSV